MPKLIHEGRFGPPKSFKTGAVVGTYPRPLFVLSFDAGGLEIVREPITYIKLEEVEGYAKKPFSDLPPITAVDLSGSNTNALTVAYSPISDNTTFPNTVAIINSLRKACPWKTVVLDTVTGLSDSIYGHQAATNASALSDPRKWAGNIGMKVKQVITYVNALPAHSVFIMHSEDTKNEQTGEISERPMIYSRLRDEVGGLFSQFFYAFIEGGVAKVRTQPFGLIKGIGCRWPAGLPSTCGATFNDIYGKEKFE